MHIQIGIAKGVNVRGMESTNILPYLKNHPREDPCEAMTRI